MEDGEISIEVAGSNNLDKNLIEGIYIGDYKLPLDYLNIKQTEDTDNAIYNLTASIGETKYSVPLKVSGINSNGIYILGAGATVLSLGAIGVISVRRKRN